MIYSGAKSLQYLSVPVYTIFKNLTIIVIAYGENYFFGTKVSRIILVSFGLMVLSSVIAAWADIQAALSGLHSVDTTAATAQLTAGYTWMGINVFCTSAFLIGSRKVMKAFNFSDVDSKQFHQVSHLDAKLTSAKPCSTTTCFPSLCSSWRPCCWKIGLAKTSRETFRQRHGPFSSSA